MRPEAVFLDQSLRVIESVIRLQGDEEVQRRLENDVKQHWYAYTSVYLSTNRCYHTDTTRTPGRDEHKIAELIADANR